jgi:hypothetical protein
MLYCPPYGGVSGLVIQYYVALSAAVRVAIELVIIHVVLKLGVSAVSVWVVVTTAC